MMRKGPRYPNDHKLLEQIADLLQSAEVENVAQALSRLGIEGEADRRRLYDWWRKLGSTLRLEADRRIDEAARCQEPIAEAFNSGGFRSLSEAVEVLANSPYKSAFDKMSEFSRSFRMLGQSMNKFSRMIEGPYQELGKSALRISRQIDSSALRSMAQNMKTLTGQLNQPRCRITTAAPTEGGGRSEE
jgi:hypothetical protein